MTAEDIIEGLQVSCVFGEIGMNEQIKELSEQAEKYANDNFKGQPIWSEAFESKFAELIVRECAEFVSNDRMNDEYGQFVANRIKEHFGVEEIE